MGTYDHKQILADYANNRITPEAAIGHSLQHTGLLYEAQTAANFSRYSLRDKVDTLENRVNALLAEVERLTALIEPGAGRSNPAASPPQST